MELAAARRRRTSAGIFTASMADVVFLLIVFFVLTYSVSPDLTRMELPRTVVRTEVPKGAAIISIAPSEDREVIRVSTGQEMAMPLGSDDELASFVANLIGLKKDQPFVVKADRRVRYQRIDTVLDTLKRSEATVVFLLSEQVVAEGGGG
jgi:biopolymer transport protein ExbD